MKKTSLLLLASLLLLGCPPHDDAHPMTGESVAPLVCADQFYCGPTYVDGPLFISGPVDISGSQASTSRRVAQLPAASIEIRPESFDLVIVPPLAADATWSLLEPEDDRAIALKIARTCRPGGEPGALVVVGAPVSAPALTFPPCTGPQAAELWFYGSRWVPVVWSGGATP